MNCWSPPSVEPHPFAILACWVSPSCDSRLLSVTLLWTLPVEPHSLVIYACWVSLFCDPRLLSLTILWSSLVEPHPLVILVCWSSPSRDPRLLSLTLYSDPRLLFCYRSRGTLSTTPDTVGMLVQLVIQTLRLHLLSSVHVRASAQTRRTHSSVKAVWTSSRMDVGAASYAPGRREISVTAWICAIKINPCTAISLWTVEWGASVGVRIMYHGSWIMYHHVCILYHESCIIIYVSCIMDRGSRTIMYASCHIHVSCIMDHVSSFMYHVSCIMDHVW